LGICPRPIFSGHFPGQSFSGIGQGQIFLEHLPATNLSAGIFPGSILFFSGGKGAPLSRARSAPPSRRASSSWGEVGAREVRNHSASATAAIRANRCTLAVQMTPRVAARSALARQGRATPTVTRPRSKSCGSHRRTARDSKDAREFPETPTSPQLCRQAARNAKRKPTGQLRRQAARKREAKADRPTPPTRCAQREAKADRPTPRQAARNAKRHREAQPAGRLRAREAVPRRQNGYAQGRRQEPRRSENCSSAAMRRTGRAATALP